MKISKTTFFFIKCIGLILLVFIIVCFLFIFDKIGDLSTYRLFYVPIYNTFGNTLNLPFFISLIQYILILGIFLILGIYLIRSAYKKKGGLMNIMGVFSCLLIICLIAMEGKVFIKDWQYITNNQFIERQVRLDSLTKTKKGRYSPISYWFYSIQNREYITKMNIYQYNQLLVLKTEFEENNFSPKDVELKVYYLPYTKTLLKYELMED